MLGATRTSSTNKLDDLGPVPWFLPFSVSSFEWVEQNMKLLLSKISHTQWVITEYLICAKNYAKHNIYSLVTHCPVHRKMTLWFLRFSLIVF